MAYLHRKSRLLLIGMLLVAPSIMRGQEIVRNMARASKQPLHQLADVEIQLERTTCFGSCPSYGVQICGHDLSVRYSGEARDRESALGLSQHLTRHDVYGLLKAFYEAQFFELPAEYDNTPYIFHMNGSEFVVLGMHTSDVPSTFLTLQVGSRRKRILLRVKVPDELTRLSERIDALVGTDRLFAHMEPRTWN